MDGRHNLFLQALRKITQEVASQEDLSKASNLLVQRIRQTTEADCCSLYFTDELRQRYRLAATDGLSQSAVGKATLKYGEGLVGVVGETRDILNLADAPANPNFKYLPDVGEEEFLSFLGVPVLDQGELLGVLVVQSKLKKIFGEQEESFMVTLAAQLGNIIMRSRQDSSTEDSFKRIKGIAATGDIAIGQALVWQPEVSMDDLKIQKCDDPLLQVELFHQAMFQLQIEMDRATLKMQEDDKNKAVSNYISGYGQLLDDPSFQDEVDQMINEGSYLATSAVKLVIEQRMKKAQEQGDKDLYLDIRDFAQVLTTRLVHSSSKEFDLSEPVILVTENMPAATVAELPQDKIAGFVVTSHSSSSHSNILARDLGIPSVLGVPVNINDIDGHMLIINAKNHEVIIDPPESVIDEFKQLTYHNKEQLDLFASELDQAVTTLDHQNITLELNAGLNLKSSSNVSKEVDGIGLYRTEIAFMLSASFPVEQQQYDWYSKLLEEFQGKPVCMRTLDIGSDKGLSYLPNTEHNPALGWRGVRVTHDMPNILHTQLKAMLRANIKYSNLEIMIPMASRLDEVLYVKKVIKDVASELTRETGSPVPLPKFGVMVEVPSLCYILDELFQEVDFISVGSNDLIQYLLAVDRSNPKVSRFYDIFHPAVVRCLYELRQKSQQYNKPITVCGEVAGNPIGAILLLSLGYTSLSMNYSEVARIKYLLRRVNFAKLQEIGQQALSKVSGIAELYQKYAQDQGLDQILK